MAQRWVGVDCGFSQLSVAIIDASDRVLAVERTRRPAGDGHEREVALGRVRAVLAKLRPFRGEPVWLAGYCYEHSGVVEAFQQEGWTVAGVTPLNDVVGVYGLTPMAGHAVVCGCGSWPQAVYVDEANHIRWPGEDVAASMPDGLPSGWAYANFLVGHARRDPGDESLARAVEEKLGGFSVDRADGRWGELGPLLSERVGDPRVRRFLSEAAAAVVETRNLFWRAVGTSQAPGLVMGGGAVRDERLWAVFERELRYLGAEALRVVGEHAVGLARFAKHHPDADPWAYVGEKKPSWLG